MLYNLSSLACYLFNLKSLAESIRKAFNEKTALTVTEGYFIMKAGTFMSHLC